MKKPAYQVLFAIAVAFVLMFAAVVKSTRGQWRQAMQLKNELQNELEKRQTIRPVLYGSPVDQLAFPEYERAVDSLSPDVWKRLHEYDTYYEDHRTSAAHFRDTILRADAAVVPQLTFAASCNDIRYELDFSRGYQTGTPHLGKHRAIAALSVLKAEQLLESGRDLEAAETLLAGMQMARDYMHIPNELWVSAGLEVFPSTCNEPLIEGGIAGEPLLGEFSVEALCLLERALATLDSGFRPMGQSGRGSLAYNLNYIQRKGVGDPYFGRGRGNWSFGSWKRGFSKRGDVAASFLAMNEWYDDLETAYGESQEAAHEFLSAGTSEFMERITPTLRTTFGGEFRMQNHRRQRILGLRFARMAVEYRLHGSVTPLADPFGTEILVIEDEDKLRFESAEAARSSRPARYSVTLDRHDF